jgi:hypothetical protein
MGNLSSTVGEVIRIGFYLMNDYIFFITTIVMSSGFINPFAQSSDSFINESLICSAEFNEFSEIQLKTFA